MSAVIDTGRLCAYAFCDDGSGQPRPVMAYGKSVVDGLKAKSYCSRNHMYLDRGDRRRGPPRFLRKT